MLYVKVAILAFLLGLPFFLLSSFLEYGVKPEEFVNVSFWLSHPLSLFVTPVICTLLVYLFQALPALASEKTEKEQGQVKWFNSSKGYGFIARDQGDDVFVHYRSIVGKGHRSLHEGQVVEFTVSMGEKGLQADDVLVISDAGKNSRRSRQ